jgi:predicted MFS family arabinose efflux permease
MLAVAPLRTLVLDGAADAPALAATLTSSAFNLGVAIGAAVGSSLLAMGLGYASLPIVALGFPLLALASLAAHVWLCRRSFRRILTTTAGAPS